MWQSCPMSRSAGGLMPTSQRWLAWRMRCAADNQAALEEPECAVWPAKCSCACKPNATVTQRFTHRWWQWFSRCVHVPTVYMYSLWHYYCVCECECERVRLVTFLLQILSSQILWRSSGDPWASVSRPGPSILNDRTLSHILFFFFLHYEYKISHEPYCTCDCQKGAIFLFCFFTMMCFHFVCFFSLWHSKHISSLTQPWQLKKKWFECFIFCYRHTMSSCNCLQLFKWSMQ